MEIVTEPDFRSAAEATAFVKELHLLLQTLGTCNCNMSGNQVHQISYTVYTCIAKNLNSA